MDHLFEAIAVFIILTLVHPLGDFVTPYRQWKGEFWIVLNPLHSLWDISPFRKHVRYVKQGNEVSAFLDKLEEKEAKQYRKTFESPFDPEKLRYYKYHLETRIIVGRSFWWWLGVDQFAHVCLNLIWAALVYMHLYFVLVLIIWPLVGVVWMKREQIIERNLKGL